MNEEIKTAVFWGVAVAMLGIATIVAWPPSEENSGEVVINEALFSDFKDPIAAASMKIVTFDEEQGQLDTFEVRKDPETGAWTIPSRQGYPADAVAQMKDAANALVDLRILDVQTSNAEDHDDLGVSEPALEDLQIGDEGVGRLVTLKDDAQKTLASLIIGDPVKDREGQLYVRKPGQDPVYVVKLDVTPLTTDFQKWIEDDLLQLSSIDVERMQIKDYNAALNVGGQISLTRNYTADVTLDGSQWKLDQLQEYDPEKPLADPKTVEVSEDDKLNTTKLNEIKNALDDLKIVNVVRKPEGMSANLRADKDLASDNKAVSSLASRGFYPVPMGPQGEYEVLSANGELTVGLKDGVQYVMRFGNIAGLGDEKDSADEGEESETSSAGVNRYLLVTTRVDESKFPAPDLKPIPQTLEEPDSSPDGDNESDPQSDTEKSAPQESAEETKAESKQVADDDPASDDAPADTTEASDAGDNKSAEEVPVKTEEAEDEELTAEEKQERLEAEQEKITKENQRLMDERKDKLEAARKRVKDLNARFADWYYVIPEETYTKLRISRDDLFEKPKSDEPATSFPPGGVPQFNFTPPK